MAATLFHPRPAYTALDLPRPRRAAAGFALLAVAALLLDAAPRLPWEAGVAAAGLFTLAGTVRALREQRELASVRRIADRLIVARPTSRDASELLRWRCAELTAAPSRERLRRDVEHTIRCLDPARLPSSSPLHRPAARACVELLETLARRLADGRPVSARGILLVRSLLCDAASPLYDEVAGRTLDGSLRHVLGALEP